MRTCLYQLFLRNWEARLRSWIDNGSDYEEDLVWAYEGLETARCARLAESSMLRALAHGHRDGDRHLWAIAATSARDIFKEILS